MLNCITPMAESRGMCLRTAGLISYTALKKEGCFLCPHSLETQGCMAAVRSPAPSPPRLSQDRGICSCQGSRSPLFPESLGDETDKRGNAPPPPPRALCQGAKRKSPPTAPHRFCSRIASQLWRTQCTRTTVLRTSTPVQFTCLKEVIANHAAHHASRMLKIQTRC